MKKFITAAALIAAGTAFANAEIITIVDTNSSGLPGSVGSVSRTNRPDSSKTLGASDDKGNSIVPTSDGVSELLSLKTDFGWVYSCGTFLANSNFPVSVSDSLVSVTVPGAASWCGQFIADIIDLSTWDYSAGDLSSVSVSFGLSGTATNAYYSAWIVDSSGDVSMLGLQAIDLSASSGTGTIVTLTDTETYTSSNDASKLVVVLSTGPGSETTAGISSLVVTGTAIPEPSAFGLLAGVGALALVASRRRRK